MAADASGVLPAGVVTFVFTDVVGSTAMWETEPGAMGAAMKRHDRLVEDVVERAGGQLVRPRGEGDSRFAVFASCRAAVIAAVEINLVLQQEDWTTSRVVQVRTAVHTGEAEERGGDYYGDAVNRAARLRGLAHPGQVLMTATTARIAESAGPLEPISLRDLGEHRMKDLSRPERVLQVVHPELRDGFPPLPSLDRARHNLPVQLSSFIGRAAEVAAVAALVNEHRLVTITGFGGMGKTRLALQVAAELADGDGDGVWLIDLSAETDPDRVAPSIAAAIGIDETADGPQTAVLRGLADKRLLLVLDNLEQIPGCARFLSDLLATAPGVHVLATSRSSLGVRGEHVYRLEPLGFAAGPTTEVSDELGSSAAARLFIDRAFEVRHDFAVTDETAPAVVAICSRLEGHPLSIELAAARTRVLSLPALLTRLGVALPVLASAGEGRPERQRTLRATVTWSYELLSAPARQLLDCLSVFAGSMSLDAVEAVCGPAVPGIDPLEGMTELVESSLVRAQGDVGVTAELRYALLIPIREYAAERLASAGLDHELSRRHAAYYRALQTKVADRSPESVAAQDRLVQAELHNMRAALTYYRTHGTAEDEAAFVCGDFIEQIDAQGLQAEVRALASSVLAHAHRPSRATALARYYLSWACYYLGEQDQARREAADAVDDARAAGEPDVAAVTVILSLQQERSRAELQRLIDIGSEAVHDLPPVGNLIPRWTLELMWDNAVVDTLMYIDPGRARQAARSMLDRARATKQPGDLGTPVYWMVYLLCNTGEYTAASEYVAQLAVEVSRAGTPAPARLKYLLAMSRASLGTGDVAKALMFAGEARNLGEHLGVRFYIAGPCIYVAEALLLNGDVDSAIDELRRAVAVLDGSDDPAMLGVVEWRLARALRLGRSPDPDLLDRAWSHLASLEWERLPEVLGYLIERAVHSAPHNPCEAAHLVGLVLARRGTFVLPMGVAGEIDPLIANLRDRLGDLALDQQISVAAEAELPGTE